MISNSWVMVIGVGVSVGGGIGVWATVHAAQARDAITTIEIIRGRIEPSLGIGVLGPVQIRPDPVAASAIIRYWVI